MTIAELACFVCLQYNTKYIYECLYINGRVSKSLVAWFDNFKATRTYILLILFKLASAYKSINAYLLKPVKAFIKVVV